MIPNPLEACLKTLQVFQPPVRKNLLQGTDLDLESSNKDTEILSNSHVRTQTYFPC